MISDNNKLQQAGYFNNILEFAGSESSKVIEQLNDYVEDAGPSQQEAWKDSIEVLKRLSLSLGYKVENCQDYSIILEYTIPLEKRRIDALLILVDTIVLIDPAFVIYTKYRLINKCC